MNNAPGVPRDRWFAMTRLDENRAKSQLAQKGRRGRHRRHQPGDLGQPFRHAVSRFLQCENQWPTRDRK